MPWTRRLILCLAAAALVAVGVGGCPPVPTSKTVLAGTWTLINLSSDNPGLTSVQLTFDNAGELTSVSYVYGSGPTVTRQLTDTFTKVSGTAVTVTSTDAIFTLDFTGTLNSEKDFIKGNMSWEAAIGTTKVTGTVGPNGLSKGAGLTGRASAGQTFYTNQGCADCHNGTTAKTAAHMDAGKVVNDLGSISSQMDMFTLTDQEVADIKAYLTTQ